MFVLLCYSFRIVMKKPPLSARKHPSKPSRAAEMPPAIRRGAPKNLAGRAAGSAPSRVRAILAGLDEAYADVTCALQHRDAFQLLIATILSAQCTDERVNQVTPALFAEYPTPEAFAYANSAAIEAAIRPTGFFRNKTKSILAASTRIVEHFS